MPSFPSHGALVALICCCLFLSTLGMTSSPTAEMFGRMAETLVNGLEIVESMSISFLPDSFFRDVRSRTDVTPLASIVSCTACLAIFDAATFANLNGLEYADVRDELIVVCEGLFNATGLQGEIMCPGILDNYAPHVLEIMRIKPTNDSREVCELFNSCAVNRTLATVSAQDGKTLLPTGSLSTEAKLERRQKQLPSGVDRETLRLNSLRIVHLTDIHVNERYLEGSATDCGLLVCCMPEYPGEGAADYWGEYTCNSPPRTTELFFQQISEMNPPPNYAIYTGDSPPHTTWLETQEGQLSAARWVAETMYRYLPDLTTYVTMGNHENYPSNLYFLDRPESQELNKDFFSAWQPLAKWTSEQQQTIEYAGYYTIIAQPGLRVLAFNTNYGYTFNWYNWINIDRQDYFDTMNFIASTLANARANGEKVIMVGHHPTGSSDCIIEWGRFITDILLEYSDIIVLYPMGHTHRDEFHLVIDPVDGQAKAIEYLSGTANSYTLANPSARIFYLDPVTFQVLDYDHYILDIDPVPPTNATLKLSYTASVEYGLADLTPASWYELTSRFEDDNALFDKYADNLKARSGDNACNNICKRNEICSMRSSSYDQYENCTSRGY